MGFTKLDNYWSEVYLLCIYTERYLVKTHIAKWGNSLALRIPKSLLNDLELKAGGGVDVTVENGRLIVTPVSPDYGLEELVQGITLENRHSETDWGPSVGAEVW